MSVLVISEDGSPYSPKVIQLLVSKMFSLLRRGVNLPAIRFEPLANNYPHLQAVVTGNALKNRGNRRLIDLGRALAAKVSTHGGFVIYHVDADQPFSKSKLSDNAVRVPEIVREQVRKVLTNPLTHRRDNKPEISREEVERRIARILFVIPHYSIESWLYQNTTKATELLAKHHGGRDIPKFEAWAKDRTLLDEVWKPKEDTALGASYNRDLADTGYPTEPAFQFSPSFAAAVNTLLNSEMAGNLPVWGDE